MPSKCHFLVCSFQHCTVLEFLTPKVDQSSRSRASEFFFWKKWPFNGNFATKRFTSTRIHVFMSGFMEIHEEDVTKMMHGIHHKNLHNVLVLVSFLGWSCQQFYTLTLSPVHPSFKFCFYPCTFQADMHDKNFEWLHCRHEAYNASVWLQWLFDISL